MTNTRIIALLSLLIVSGCSRSAIQQPAVVGTSSVPSVSLPSALSQASESSQPAASEALAAKPRIDACALLTSKEVKAVQGEELKEAKSAAQSAGGFAISQCFFTLPTFSNSISLMVAEKGNGPDATEPEEFWRERFHEDMDQHDDKDRAREREKDRAREREKDKGSERVAQHDQKRGEAEEEEGAPPQKISGVGDEAYWVGNRIGGALYVLKGDAYLRISIGGPLDQTGKIRKSRVLAKNALARL
jgi:hypothetical protein